MPNETCAKCGKPYCRECSILHPGCFCPPSKEAEAVEAKKGWMDLSPDSSGNDNSPNCPCEVAGKRVPKCEAHPHEKPDTTAEGEKEMYYCCACGDDITDFRRELASAYQRGQADQLDAERRVEGGEARSDIAASARLAAIQEVKAVIRNTRLLDSDRKGNVLELLDDLIQRETKGTV